MPNVFTRGDSDMTEERIAHILSEASQLMNKSSHNQDPDTRSNEDSKSPNRGQVRMNVIRKNYRCAIFLGGEFKKVGI